MTPPEDFRNPQVSSINDIPLFKMYRVSSKSLEEENHPTLEGVRISLTERKHRIVIFMTLWPAAASIKPDFCFLLKLIVKNKVHLGDGDI